MDKKQVQALELIGVEGDLLRTLWRAICIVLQLGNLEFERVGDDAYKIVSTHELDDLSELMGIPSDQMTTALTLSRIHI